MVKTILIDNIPIEVERKRMKTIRLCIYPLDCRVHVSVPKLVSQSYLEQFIRSRLPWIRKKLQTFSAVKRPAKPRYETGETVRYLGQTYKLFVNAVSGRQTVVLEGDSIILGVRANALIEQKEKLLYEWYRKQLKVILDRYLAVWQEKMNVRAESYNMRRMKTEWGSCNHRTHRLMFNTELACKPELSIEYIVVHELNHINNRLHDKVFYADLERYLPDWKKRRAMLNH